MPFQSGGGLVLGGWPSGEGPHKCQGQGETFKRNCSVTLSLKDRRRDAFLGGQRLIGNWA